MPITQAFIERQWCQGCESNCERIHLIRRNHRNAHSSSFFVCDDCLKTLRSQRLLEPSTFANLPCWRLVVPVRATVEGSEDKGLFILDATPEIAVQLRAMGYRVDEV